MPSRAALAVIAVLTLTTACGSSDAPSAQPSPTTGVAVSAADAAPPQLPADFTWTGRYIVPDLDLEVPFTWTGDGGDLQMVAGGPDEPIHFTNIIADGALYTLTYTWPDIPRLPCTPVGPLTIDDVNAGLAAASFVGAETLDDVETRSVFHYRSAFALEIPPDALDLPDTVPVVRVPIMSGDIYVDRDDPSKIWKLLHFGVQNLYDVDLDEWIVIDEISETPGEVVLPDECLEAASTTTPTP